MNTKFNNTIVETNGVRTIAGGGTGTTTLGSLRDSLEVLSLSGGVISANTTTNALRITQTGTGNALLIEDDTNPDSTSFLIDQKGTLVIGASAASGTVSNATRLAQFVSIGAPGLSQGGGSGKRIFELRNHADSGTSNVLRFIKTRSNDSNDFRVFNYPLSAGDSSGSIQFYGNASSLVSIDAVNKYDTFAGNPALGSTLLFGMLSGGERVYPLILNENKVGIGGTDNPNEALTVVGNISATGNIGIGGDINVKNNEINIYGDAASSLAGQRYGLNLTNLDSFDPGQPLTVDGRARIVHGMTFQAGINNFTNGSDHTHVLWAAQNRNLWQMIQNGGNSTFDKNYFTLTTVGYNSTLTFFNEANIYSVDTTNSTINASFPFALSNVRIAFNTNQTPNLIAGDYVSIGFNPGAAGIVANTYTGTVASGPTSVTINGSTRFQYTFTLNMFNTLNWVESSKGLELVSVNASGNKNVRVSTSPETLTGTKVSLQGNYNNIPRFVLVTMNGHNAYEGESVVFNNLVSLIGISIGQWNAYVRHVINANQFVISIGNPIGGYVNSTGTTTNTTDWFIVKGSTDAIHQYNAALQHLVIQRFPNSDTSTTTTGGNRAVALGNSAEVDGDFSYALGYKSTVTGNKSVVLGGENNYVTGNNSSILGGSHNSIQGNNIFTLGSNLTASVANTTYTNNLSVIGDMYSSGNIIYDGSEFINKLPTTSTLTTSGTLFINNGGATGTSIACASQQLFLVPIWVPTDCKINQAGVYTSTNGTSVDIKICIYDGKFDGRPGKRISPVITVPTGNTSVFGGSTISPSLTLKRGNYYAGIMAFGASANLNRSIAGNLSMANGSALMSGIYRMLPGYFDPQGSHLITAVSSGSEPPDDLSSRTLDTASGAGTGITTTIRYRLSAPFVYFKLEI